MKHLFLSRTTRLILHDVGLLLHAPGIMALVSLLVCFWFGELYAIPAFLATAIAALLPAQILLRWFSPKVDQTRLHHAMLIAALAWGLISLVGAIPFLGIAASQAAQPETSVTLLAFEDLWNALFESFSGFTGTGLSMAQDASALPHSLQWWRSLSEWIDGVGVIILVLAVLEPEVEATQLYSATGRQRTIANTVGETARKIIWIYLSYTGLSILVFALLGMPLWEAINHGLTGISTGGFSVTKQSITAYSPLIQFAIVAFMIAGAISFPVHYQLLRYRHWSAFWQSPQHRLLFLLLGLGSLGLGLENRWFEGSFFWSDSLFQWTSALTTCGFSTVDLQDWSVSTKLTLSAAMLVGGAAGSTVGGLKLNRIIVLFRGLRWQLQRHDQSPDRQRYYHLNGEKLTVPEARHKIKIAATLTLLWFLLLGVGVVNLSHLVADEYSLTDVLFEATSASSNVGLSTGISNPTLPWNGKFILIGLMWMGRLEIIPVLLLATALIRAITRSKFIQP